MNTTVTPEKAIIGGVVAVVGALFVVTAFIQPRSTAPASASSVTPESVGQQNELKVRWACEDAIKAKLNDPDSYKARNVEFFTAKDSSNSTWVQVRVDFGARNGFGGMVPGKAACNFDRNAVLTGSAVS